MAKDHQSLAAHEMCAVYSKSNKIPIKHCAFQRESNHRLEVWLSDGQRGLKYSGSLGHRHQNLTNFMLLFKS